MRPSQKAVTFPPETDPARVIAWNWIKEDLGMSRKCYSAEEIVSKLRQADVELGAGSPSWRCVGCWVRSSRRTAAGGRSTAVSRPIQAKRLKDLEKANARLKRLLADAELDKAILKEAASGVF